jgi:pyruvate ferredoxin oxidoreductase gamma subunit
MIEIRFHGRGGQGAVTSAIILAKAVGKEGKHSQAFSAFGPERRGAPVRAFCRISSSPITLRSQVYTPDYVIVLDPSLLNLPEVSEGLKEDSEIIINTDKPVNSPHSTHTYDATKLALGVLGKEIVNTAMLGVFAKATNLVRLESLLDALGEVFSGKVLESNRELVKKAYQEVKE